MLAPPCAPPPQGGGARGGWLADWRRLRMAWSVPRLGDLGHSLDVLRSKPRASWLAARPESRPRGMAAGRAPRLAGWVRPGRAGRAEPSQLLLPLARNLDPAAPAWPSGLARCFSNAAGTVPGSNPGSAISARTPARGQGGQPEVDRGKFPLELAAAGAFLCKRRNPCIL